MNKSLFTTMTQNTDKAGSCGCAPFADSKPVYNINDSWFSFNYANDGYNSQSEQHLYGSSRLGIFNRNIDADASLPAGTSANLIGNYFTGFLSRSRKAYELSNHLGNVLATISDKKTGVDNNSDGIVDYDAADIISANDYYPFGMGMPGRKYSIANTNYRYGFNGKENDNDIEDGIQDYGMRIYDTRLGRFMSVDPLGNEYPELSTYPFASNSPISNIDRDGGESEDASDALEDMREENEKELYKNLEPFEDRKPPSPPAPQGRVVTKPGLSGIVRRYIEINFNSEEAIDNLRDILGAQKVDIFNLPKETIKTPGDQALDELSKSGNSTDIENAARMRRLPKLTLPKKDQAEKTTNTGTTANIKVNQINGANREQIEEASLTKQFPGATVQKQMYLRNSNGKILKDPVTGEARRIDFVVIKNGKPLESVETTSMTANKTGQTREENRIRSAGGTFVRDRTTGKLVDISEVKTKISRRQ